MKVLERNDFHVASPFTVKCPKCGSRLQCDPDDVNRGQREGQWVNCAVCNTAIPVESTQLKDSDGLPQGAPVFKQVLR